MALRKRRVKPGNGEGRGNTFLLSFNLNDTGERRAWLMAQQLARPHGKRGHILKAFLLALADYQDQTGIELNADNAAALLLEGALFGTERVMTKVPDRQAGDKPLVKISTADKASGDEALSNFSESMSAFLN